MAGLTSSSPFLFRSSLNCLLILEQLGASLLSVTRFNNCLLCPLILVRLLSIGHPLENLIEDRYRSIQLRRRGIKDKSLRMNSKYSLSSWTYSRSGRIGRLAYFATVTVVALFVFSLAYVYVEEPPFWKPGPPRPSSEDMDTGSAHIMVSPASSHVEPGPPPPPPAAPPSQPASPSPRPAVGATPGSSHHSAASEDDLASAVSSLSKPEGLRVVGIIFYGRRDRSSILECYLRQNLVSGFLNRVEEVSPLHQCGRYFASTCKPVLEIIISRMPG